MTVTWVEKEYLHLWWLLIIKMTEIVSSVVGQVARFYLFDIVRE